MTDKELTFGSMIGYTSIGMYFSAALLGIVTMPFVMARTHKSALVKQVQPVPNGSSIEKLIMCAFAFLKSDNHGFRTSKGTDQCEQLTFGQLITLTNSSFEPDFEYFEATTLVNNYNPPLKGYGEKVVHILYSENQVGDKFQFEFLKSDTDRFEVTFRDSENNYILAFIDGSVSLRLNDRYGTDYGDAETPPYPFSEFKEYNIVFEVLQSHWQIFVADVAIKNFVHRHPV